jgi:lysyl-tRNA synthetase class II
MDDKASKQNHLKHFNEWVGGHEMHSEFKNLNMIICQRQDKKVDPQVNHQEYSEEQSCYRHDEFFCEG